MKKLLSVSFCIALLSALLVGVSGCPKDEKKTPGDTKKGLTVSKDDSIKIKVGEKKEVTVTYTIGADVKVKTIGVASDKDTIAKATVAPTELAKSGDAKVTVEGIAEGTAHVTVTATGDGTTPATTTTKITVTVDKK